MPFGCFAPAARQVQVPSPSALVSSMSIRRDMVRNRIASKGHRTIVHGAGGAVSGGYGHCVPIYALGTVEPTISSAAFVHPDAVVIGDVWIGPESTIWPGAVLRGDGGGAIRVGANTSIQDNSVIHTTPDVPTIVGDRCVIGHLVHLESCTIEDEVLIGNAAMVLHHSVIRTGAIVAANSVVLYNVDVPAGALAVGSPAVIKRGAAKSELIAAAAASYTERARTYPSLLRRIG